MDTCRMAFNENSLGPSPLAVQAARRAMDRLNRYPESDGRTLADELARRHLVGVDEVILGNGSAELIELLIRTFCTSGCCDEVLAAAPSFPIYRHNAEAQGVGYTGVSLDSEMRFDVDGLAAAATHRTKLCFICNPNNPTGSYLARRELERLARVLPRSTLLVIDEAYCEYVTATDFPQSMELRGLNHRLITLRTFSKAYGLAGLRVGYMVLSSDLAQHVRRFCQPFRVNSLAQIAALAALGDHDHLVRTRLMTAEGMTYLSQAFDRLGVRHWPSQANFLLIDPHGLALLVYEALLLRGVHVSFVGEIRCLRVTVGLPEQNVRLVRIIETVLANQPGHCEKKAGNRNDPVWPDIPRRKSIGTESWIG